VGLQVLLPAGSPAAATLCLRPVAPRPPAAPAAPRGVSDARPAAAARPVGPGEPGFGGAPDRLRSVLHRRRDPGRGRSRLRKAPELAARAAARAAVPDRGAGLGPQPVPLLRMAGGRRDRPTRPGEPTRTTWRSRPR
jgi:hypothetical protein